MLAGNFLQLTSKVRNQAYKNSMRKTPAFRKKELTAGNEYKDPWLVFDS
jgi:hypothetical protein